MMNTVCLARVRAYERRGAPLLPALSFAFVYPPEHPAGPVYLSNARTSGINSAMWVKVSHRGRLGVASAAEIPSTTQGRQHEHWPSMHQSWLAYQTYCTAFWASSVPQRLCKITRDPGVEFLATGKGYTLTTRTSPGNALSGNLAGNRVHPNLYSDLGSQHGGTTHYLGRLPRVLEFSVRTE